MFLSKFILERNLNIKLSFGKIKVNFSMRYPKLTYLGSFNIFTNLRLLFFPKISRV